MPRIIPVKPGTVAIAEIQRLQEIGVIVVEHTEPEELAPLLEQKTDCCLESVIANLVAEVVRQVGPNYKVTAKGSLTLEPQMRGTTGNGPPVNAEGAHQTVSGDHWSYQNSQGVKWWVFVVGPSFTANLSSVSANANISYPLPGGTAYLLRPNQSITVTFPLASSLTIRTRGMLPGE
jgi:hypothetical protein